MPPREYPKRTECNVLSVLPSPSELVFLLKHSVVSRQRDGEGIRGVAGGQLPHLHERQVVSGRMVRVGTSD